ncbi:unnamed protein product [Soboliphyme baturini]|uniref:YBD domain-containing protein n=1 Tax=Soboliphyme baturini TaxID=241478 RepID=A0A183IDP6_9BILA|nr:unnamed protein product [Soboliphyme baturini]
MGPVAATTFGGLYGGSRPFWQTGFSPPPSNPLNSTVMSSPEMDVKPSTAVFGALGPYGLQMPPPSSLSPYAVAAAAATNAIGLASSSPWEGRLISGRKIRLCEFSAYCLPDPGDSSKRHEMVNISSAVTPTDPMLEAIDISQIYDKFPSGKTGLRELYERGPQNCFFLIKFWADVSFNVADEQAALFAVDSRYESSENITISVSTKVCSFGKQVVEKVEHEYPKYEKGRFMYRISRSPMCEYMNNFIHKLKKLPERYMMNSVLENFTILQLVTAKDTQEALLCTAFVFEVSDGDGSQHRVYRLTHGNK